MLIINFEKKNYKYKCRVLIMPVLKMSLIFKIIVLCAALLFVSVHALEDDDQCHPGDADYYQCVN